MTKTVRQASARRSISSAEQQTELPRQISKQGSRTRRVDPPRIRRNERPETARRSEPQTAAQPLTADAAKPAESPKRAAAAKSPAAKKQKLRVRRAASKTVESKSAEQKQAAISTAKTVVDMAAPKKVKSGTRVQLRLSKSMVRILKAFSKTGRHPSVIVERALWKDGSIRDAAAILRIAAVQKKPAEPS